MCLVCPTPCEVRLGITGAEHTRPCWYLCWYLFRTVLCSACTVLRLVRTGHVPTCPCLHLYRYFLCSWTARALYLLARVLNVPTCPCLYRTYVSVLVSPCTVFVMGNPSHVRVLVFGLSRCNCIATPIDMDMYLCWLFVLDL